MNNIKGVFYGIATAVTFGLIPLFTLPLLGSGMNTNSVLFYRFSFATLALAIMMLLNKESFKLTLKDIPVLLLLGVFYTCSAMFLLMGYEYMSSGIATSIHFTYPIFVTVFLFLVFRQKASKLVWVAILLAVAGVAVLSMQGAKFTLDMLGMFIVLLSAVAYALYIVGVNKSHLSTMNGRKLAFYVFIVSSMFFGVKSFSGGGIMPIKSSDALLNLVALSVLPTVISNITLVIAVRNIGGTMTSVLGAMEPVTAVLVGAIVFGEKITLQSALGILIIILAVTIIILSSKIMSVLSSVLKRERPRHA